MTDNNNYSSTKRHQGGRWLRGSASRCRIRNVKVMTRIVCTDV
jgi:hypothetical protein